MKPILLLTLALVTTLSSCGDKQINKGSSSKYRNSIVLGNFNDTVTHSTLDESQLNDLPRSINLKDDMTIAKNQGSRGTCTFFSTAALIEATIKKDQNLDVNISEEYISYVTKAQGYFRADEGSNVRSNIVALSDEGILLERDYSYQPSWFDKGLPCEKFKAEDKQAPEECFTHSKPAKEILAKVISAKNITFQGAYKNTNEIIRFLAEEKRPLTLSLPVNFNGWPDTGLVRHNEELRQECLSKPESCGGHSVLLTGYDLDKKLFFFKNSWGKNWGEDGHGSMTFETLDLYAGNDIYIAKLTDNLDIPKNYNENLLKVIKFNSSSSRVNDSLKISVETEFSNALGRTLYISSFLSKKHEGVTDLPDDNNTSLISQNAEESKLSGESFMRAIHYLLKPLNNQSFDADNAINLTFVPGSETSIKTALKSESEVLIRSTMYVHNDINSWEILKREYLPISK